MVLVYNVNLDPHTEYLVPTNIHFRDNLSMKHSAWMNQRSEPVPGICVAHSSVPNRALGVPIRLVNTNNRPVMLTQGTALGNLELVTVDPASAWSETTMMTSQSDVNTTMNTIPKCSLFNGPTQLHDVSAVHMGNNGLAGTPVQPGMQFLWDGESLTHLPINQPLDAETEQQIDEIIHKFVEAVDPTVPQQYRDQLATLLNKHRHLLSVDDFDVGLIPGMEHVIDTGNAPPFCQKLRRHAPAQEKIINEQVDQLLKQGIIRPSMSPYASNVVLAKKHDKGWRLCIDHRQLNLQSQTRFFCPRVKDTIQKMSGIRWFTALDLRLTYHCLEIA